jgi:hypothetical protein
MSNRTPFVKTAFVIPNRFSTWRILFSSNPSLRFAFVMVSFRGKEDSKPCHSISLRVAFDASDATSSGAMQKLSLSADQQ